MRTSVRFCSEIGVTGSWRLPCVGQRKDRLPTRGALKGIGLPDCRQPCAAAKCYFTVWLDLSQRDGSKSQGERPVGIQIARLARRLQGS